MNKYISTLLIGAALVGFTSCNDFLDKEPESSIIPEGFFKNESDLAAYSVNMYGNFTTHSNYSYQMGTFSIDNGTDNQAAMGASNRWAPGQWQVPTSGGLWDFTFIRNVNYFLERVLPLYDAGQITGTDTNVRQYIGEMYFFRAYAYWLKYSELGDFPIITEALPDQEDVLLEASVRQPRNKVARFMLDDLAKAIDFLPDNSVGGKQRINKACAQLLRSRVALFEGTWLKYHKGTALVPGGKGWPGSAELLGSFDIDSEIQYFLREAMASAKPVGDAIVGNLAANTDTPEGISFEGAGLNPYYNMFTDTNLDGYAEVLLYKQYTTSLGNNFTININMQLERNGCGSGWTRSLVNSYLMRNGLPIYAAGSGYDPEWELQGVTATLQDRDSRIQIFTKGDGSVDYYNSDGTINYWREGWLLDGTSETRCVTGYGCKKGKDYTVNKATNHWQSTNGSIIFRATEAMLNYMEACAELNGSIDDTADRYWRALRKRAYVNDDYQATIAATNVATEAETDWSAMSHNQLVSSLIFNVRRERRNELIAEGHRMNDLRRWCALDQLIAKGAQIEGIKFWGSVYDASAGENPLNLKNESGNVIYANVAVEDGTGNMSDPNISGPYVRPYQISKLNNIWFDGYRWTRAHYLTPIAQSAFRKASPDHELANSVIYQNPGWEKVGSTAAQNID